VTDVWADLHTKYNDRDWINKSSLFAETAITYFPEEGKILDLGAGQGQDSRFFAEHGYEVVSTDIEDIALEQSRSKLPDAFKDQVAIQRVDLRQELPFDDESFDIVYAHLSLHYFDHQTTMRIFDEIGRVLKPAGILAFFTNSVDDPECNEGEKLEDDYYMVGKTAKRFFSVDTAKVFAHDFDVILADNNGETYKDLDKGVHNLIRFIGTKQA